ncbi:MAG TPA: HAD family hydrolase [Acidimicrobiales bacterium]|nr:HAD family hydrolase [Acidimicrobiales bacterium]
MIRAAIFDFYGTLARAVSWGPDVASVLVGHGLRLDEAARAAWEAEMFDGMEHHEHSASRDHYLAWERERLRRLAQASGAGPDDVEPLAAELHAATRDFRMAAYDEVPAVLDELRDRGLVVAVCSNWTWDLQEALDQAGLGQAADVVVTSAQAGVRKPHPGIFTLTLERCAVDAAEAVFVGDTWFPDVEGALTAGLLPVHVWREGDPWAADPPPPLPDGVHRVSDLRGVLELL